MRYLLASMPLALMPAVNAAQDASNESLEAAQSLLAEMAVLMGVHQIPQNIEEISAAIFILLFVLLLTVCRRAAEEFGRKLGVAVWDKSGSVWKSKPDRPKPAKDLDQKPSFLENSDPRRHPMKDFFISYTQADRTWAEWIAWQLEEAGYTTVLQAWDFQPASNFVLEMDGATKEAERTIPVLSPDYFVSRFAPSEWAAAFKEDPTGEKSLILPVRVGDCDPEGLLGSIVYIDLTDLDEEPARDRLLAGVEHDRAKPATLPSFPEAEPRSVEDRPTYPGALPPIWNITHLRNRNFTGRKTLLDDLHTILVQNNLESLRRR